MNRFYFILFAVHILLAKSTGAHAQSQSKVIWKDDIEYCLTELPKKHKDLFFRFPKEQFEASLQNLKNLPDTMSDLCFALKLQQIIVKVGDAHTSVRYSDFLNKDKFLPFSFVWLSDGLTINSTTKQNSEILGGKLKRINGYITLQKLGIS